MSIQETLTTDICRCISLVKAHAHSDPIAARGVSEEILKKWRDVFADLVAPVPSGDVHSPRVQQAEACLQVKAEGSKLRLRLDPTYKGKSATKDPAFPNDACAVE